MAFLKYVSWWPRYLNSGCIAGYAFALKLATGRILEQDFNNQYVMHSR